MRARSTLLVLLLLGCSEPEAEPEPETPSPEAPQPEAPQPTEPQPEEPECVLSVDCTVVLDRCGRPYGRPNDDLDVPPAADPCPPADYAPAEPFCRAGECATRSASGFEHRRCESDDDCVIVETACESWSPAARGHEDAVRESMAAAIEGSGCPPGFTTNRRPEPGVACVNLVCVDRAPAP